MMFKHTLTFTRDCRHPGPKHTVTATFEAGTLQELVNSLARTVNRPCVGHLPPVAWEQSGLGSREKAIRLNSIARREQQMLARADLRVELYRLIESRLQPYDENGENICDNLDP